MHKTRQEKAAQRSELVSKEKWKERKESLMWTHPDDVKDEEIPWLFKHTKMFHMTPREDREYKKHVVSLLLPHFDDKETDVMRTLLFIHWETPMEKLGDIQMSLREPHWVENMSEEDFVDMRNALKASGLEDDNTDRIMNAIQGKPPAQKGKNHCIVC